MPDTWRPGTRRPGHTYCPMRPRWLLVFGNTLGRLWSVAGARGELAEVMITIVGDHALYSVRYFLPRFPACACFVCSSVRMASPGRCAPVPGAKAGHGAVRESALAGSHHIRKCHCVGDGNSRWELWGFSGGGQYEIQPNLLGRYGGQWPAWMSRE